MNLAKALFSHLTTLMSWLTKSKLRLGIAAVVIIAAGWGIKSLTAPKQQTQYQTAPVTRGDLIQSITASGTVTAGNSVDITSNATGVVTQVYVQNGDTVSQGQKIADITLDQDSQAKQAQAWSSYLSAKNSLDAAQAKLNSLQASAFQANQKFINDAVARELTTDDPTYIEESATWKQAEADYKNQSNVINQSQASLSSAWLSYSQISPTITAPINGTVTGLTLTPGLAITSTSQSSTNTSSNTKYGSVTMDQGGLQAKVNVSEIDAPKITPGQRVTMTLDAFPDKTFSGKVLTIDSNGTISSGVTTYPTSLSFDSAVAHIYPNMAVSATIITDVKYNTLLVPNAAVQTQNDQTTVRILQNGNPVNVPVEVGASNDTQTEILSGLSEGQMVITNVISPTTRARTGQTTSPFGGTNRGFGGGGGAVFRRGG